MRVLVVGAGISGCGVALELGRRGHDVEVIERAPGPRDEGYMVDFFGPGFDAAEAMGLHDDLAAIHYPIDRLDFREPDGRQRIAIPYAKLRARAFDNRHCNFMRGDLEHVLFDRAKQHAEFRFATTLVELHPGADAAEVTLDDGTQLTVDLVIGADGQHSDVRARVFGPEDRFEVALGHLTAAYLLDALPGAAPEDAFSTVDAPGRMAAVYPIRGGRAAAFFVYRSHDMDRDIARGPAQDLRSRFGALDWIVPELLEAMPDDGVYFDRVSQITCERWYHERVVLVGDAAWCVSLLAGQGASLALAGAHSLAVALTDGDDIMSALRSWSDALKPAVERRQHSGRRTARWFVPESRPRLHMRDLMMRAAAWPIIGPVVGRGIGAGRAAT